MEMYVKLVKLARKLMKDGRDGNDPSVKSTIRKATHYWKQMSLEDKGLADLLLFER